jgi:hypothetical protein
MTLPIGSILTPRPATKPFPWSSACESVDTTCRTGWKLPWKFEGMPAKTRGVIPDIGLVRR